MIKSLKILLTLALGASITTACQNTTQSTTPSTTKEAAKTDSVKPSVSNDPVELTFFSVNSIPDEEFELYARSVKVKYPNITLKWLKNSPEITVPKLITAGQPPDLIVASLQHMPPNVLEYKMQLDLDEYIKKFNTDLSKIDPVFLNSMKQATKGKLYGLPINNGGGNVMFYNKSIFDRFGMPYPKDGMTWDDAYNLSKTLTKTDQGVQYVGAGMSHNFLLTYNSWSKPIVDSKTGKAAVNTADWNTLFQNFARFYQHPGINKTSSTSADGNDEQVFLKEQRMAMFTWGGYRYKGFPAELNWDMVSVPTLSEAPKTAPQGNPRYMFISNTTKNKDHAFQALTALLSEDIQTQFSKSGIGSSLNNDSIKKAFGQDVPQLKGKNTGAIFYNPLAETVELNSVNINNALDGQFRKVMEGGKDVNTALRDAEEAINKLLEEENKK
jgi:ABC-type glycerol-3-phosphate transport system substrate-binding protein